MKHLCRYRLSVAAVLLGWLGYPAARAEAAVDYSLTLGGKIRDCGGLDSRIVRDSGLLLINVNNQINTQRSVLVDLLKPTTDEGRRFGGLGQVLDTDAPFKGVLDFLAAREVMVLLWFDDVASTPNVALTTPPQTYALPEVVSYSQPADDPGDFGGGEGGGGLRTPNLNLITTPTSPPGNLNPPNIVPVPAPASATLLLPTAAAGLMMNRKRQRPTTSNRPPSPNR